MAYKSGVLRVSEHRGWGGNHLNYVKYASLFRDERPHQFGEVASLMFSAEIDKDIINARFHYHTEAVGNVHYLRGGMNTYEWNLPTDDTILYTVVEQVETDANKLYGRGGETFKIGLDVGYLEEPVLLKSDDDNAPLFEIIGRSERSAIAGSYIYTFRLQTGHDNVGVDLSTIALNAQFNREATAVADELNQKFGGIEFSNGSKLRSHTGQVANKFTFTDKAVRRELATEGKDQQQYRFGNQSIVNAFSNWKLVEGITGRKRTGSNGQKGKVVPVGMMITHAEYAISERCIRDREGMMEFGHNEISRDRDSNFTRVIAPGWRQLILDGNLWVHTGNITLTQLEDFFHTLFFQHRGFKDRHVVLSTGTGGITMLSRMFKRENAYSQYPDANFFVRERGKKNSGLHAYELEVGAQITAWRLDNGITLELKHDPGKDDKLRFRTCVPGTEIPVESYAIDIYDIGESSAADSNAKGKANVTMIKQSGVDSYYTVSSVIDLRKGVMTGGGNVPTNSKECGIYMELSGSLCIWDITRCARIEFRVKR